MLLRDIDVTFSDLGGKGAAPPNLYANRVPGPFPAAERGYDNDEWMSG
jgi:hypothetical protein